MRHLHFLAAVALVATVVSPPVAAQEEPPVAVEEGMRYQENGDPGGFLNVVPPGQDGVLNTAEILAAQGGTLPPLYANQVGMYENLVYEGGLPVAGEHGEPLLGVTDGDLMRFFKDASFGTNDTFTEVDVSVCGDDVVAFRDTQFGVPHIYGETRESAQCANGYLTAEDRLFLMDLLRHVGYARMSEFLGASEANQAMDRGQLLVAPYAEADYLKQEEDICGSDDPEFQQVCTDGTAYIEGVNHYIAAARQDPSLLPGEYAALQINPEDFILRDILATASLVGGIFGKGGGNEAANSMFMAGLIEQHGEEQAREIFDDLKAANDPDASLTIQAEFPYNNSTGVDPASTVLLDPESFVGAFDGASTEGGGLALPPPPFTDQADTPVGLGVVDGPFGPIDLRGQIGMSNAILAGASVTDSGVPIAVFGPQTGYFTPQLLVETDIHAPGLDARGVAFAGTNIYVQLGRGRDYAWSATSASGDMVDEWALELCDPAGGDATIDSTGYVWNGTCALIPIHDHMQVAKPTAGGVPSGPDIILTYSIGRIPELNDAPVVGRALTTDGVPVAIAEQRSTLKSELDSALGFQRINNPDFMTDGPESFNRAFDGVDFTFNWFYIDEENIAYRHSCLCPVRDPRDDPDLLTWGGRGYEWTGEFLTPEQQPAATNPEEGWFANWNNKQANGFRSEDDSWKHHSTDRREHLAQRLQAAVDAGVPLTRGDMVNIMEDAGTVDLNPQEIYPLALEIMGAAPPESVGEDAARLTEMRDLLAAWVAAGGHRRDVDHDAVYDHAVAVAIGDAWVRPMLEAVLGDEVPLALWPEGIEDHPRQGVGSAYNSGQMRFLQKDFWQVVGQPMLQERSRTYCGDGTAPSCATALWTSLGEAAALLESLPEGSETGPVGCDFPGAYQFGSATVGDWVYNPDCDNIVPTTAGVVGTPAMRWINRPTFHQVVEAGTRSGRINGRDRVSTAAAVSRQAFPDGAETVVLAAAGNFADAVAGTPLAAARMAPLLLTDSAGLSPATGREIARLGATSAVILGGTAAISQAVETSLTDLGLTVSRVAGDNRYETAVAIAADLGQAERFVLASAASFADALAAGPFAAADDRAILLTDAEALPPAVATVLEAATDVVIAGGEAAVSTAVEQAVTAGGATVARVGGANRYDTALGFTNRTIEAGALASRAYLVTGEAFPDALTAAAAAAHTGAILALVNPSGLASTPATRDLLVAQAETLWLVGGPAALPSALRAELEVLL